MKAADVVVVLVDAGELAGSTVHKEVDRVLDESGAFEGDVADVSDGRILAVVNKIDTNPAPAECSITLRSGEKIPLLPVSCKTEDGLPAFVSTLTQLTSSMQALLHFRGFIVIIEFFFIITRNNCCGASLRDATYRALAKLNISLDAYHLMSQTSHCIISYNF